LRAGHSRGRPMKRFVNPFARRSPSDSSHTARIKDWVRAQLRLSADTVVSVNEVACRDAGCPDLETVIGILRAGLPIHMLRVERPIPYVTKDHIALAIQIARRAGEFDDQARIAIIADEDCCAKNHR
jgi:hypothetical protein